MIPRRFIRSLPSHLFLIGVSLLVVFPIVWMISSAFKLPQELFSEEIHILPQNPTLENFVTAWQNYGVPRWMFNSFVTSTGITVGQIATSLLAAYAFGTFVFRGRETLFAIFLGTLIVPFQVTMIPNYILITKMDLLNTWWAVILPNLPNAFGVFLLRQYFLSFPRELLDAARLDGATSWQVLWRILAPLSKAPIFALSVLFFLDAWNQYFWPLLVLTEPAARTIPIGLQQFLDSETGHRWGPFMASATIACLPTLFVYLVAQKRIIGAAITSGFKG
jgi:sn-glycerol 3-phosphate transport system permease protein